MRAICVWRRLGAVFTAASLSATLVAQDVLTQVWARAGACRSLHQATFSPDGERVAIAGAGIVVPIVRVRDGLVEREIRLPDFDRAKTVAFSPDGSLLAVGTQVAAIWVVRVADGLPMQVIYPHASPIAALAFSPDGRYLVSSDGNFVQTTRLSDGAIVRTFVHANVQRCLFAPNGAILATVSIRDIHLWSFPDGALLRVIPLALPFYNAAAAASFSPDGQWLATHYFPSKEIRIWRVADGALMRQAIYNAEALNGLTFTRDGRFLVSAHADAIILWDAATLTPLQQRDFVAYDVEASPQPNYFLITNRYFTRLWQVEGLSIVNELSSFVGPISDLVASPSDAQLATVNQEFVRIWDAATGALRGGVWALIPVRSVAFSPADEAIIAIGGRTQNLGIYNLRTNQWLNKFYTGGVRQLEFSPNGAQLAAAIGNYVTFYNLPNNSRRSVARSSEVWGVRWVDNQRCLILDAEGNLLLWDTAQNQQERAIAFTGVGRGLTVTYDRRLAAVNLRDRVAIVRLPDLSVLQTISSDSSPILAAQLTPNGRYLITGDEAGQLLIWRVADGVLVRQDTSATGLEMDSAINNIVTALGGQRIAFTRSDGMLFTVRNPFPLGDVNGDGCVDDTDLLSLLFAFGESDSQADLNADGVVDDADLLVVLFEFGLGCE